METSTVYELIGYVASALIVLSLLMASVLKLRVINLIGAAVFTVYGVLIGSVPVIATNAAIVLINVYYLVRLLGDRSSDAYFEVVPIGRHEPLLHRFVEQHRDDIRAFQPAFDGLRDDHLAWFVLRDAVPVGVVLGRLVPGEGPDAADEHGVLHLDVDHVTAPHRDFSPGAVLFGEASVLRTLPIDRVRTAPGNDTHRRYLRRMGFEDAGDHLVRSI